MKTPWIAAVATLSLAAAFARAVKGTGSLVEGTVDNDLAVKG